MTGEAGFVGLGAMGAVTAGARDGLGPMPDAVAAPRPRMIAAPAPRR